MRNNEFDGLGAELAALPTTPATRKGPPCTVGAVLSSVTPEAADTLRRILDTATVTSAAIAAVLSQHGPAIAANTVARHRRRGEPTGCRCPLPPSSHAVTDGEDDPRSHLMKDTMGLYRKDGSRIAKAALPVAPLDDPLVTVTADIYQSEPYGRGDAQPEGSKQFLLYPAGSVVRRSVVERLFTPATVSAISPAKGPAAGGTIVMVKGADLDGVTAVKFGGKPGTELRVRSATELSVKTPVGAAGIVVVEVATDAGTVSKANGYTYEA
ncbi:IPT/TIG domain-containing protein [Streptomyces sp. NPDC048717]|uniref:IPT/TIG domain-containing protein n=1 Tax=Streptomyces sp. NPDC048717 TaxID=3154928 RepID=UPI003447909C